MFVPVPPRPDPPDDQPPRPPLEDKPVANPTPADAAEQPAELGPLQKGSIRLFRLAGIDVFVHWSWFLAAFWLIDNPIASYSSYAWVLAEYLLAFGIVLLHEFGHVLACRQVGGTAEHVVLWPLGGLAFVYPPPRPGATLWTIAAGPLVNVVLIPVILALAAFNHLATWNPQQADLGNLIRALTGFNLVVLIFNLLPIYPLDGGQILQSLLWFLIGRVRSLKVAAVTGLLAGSGLMLLGLALSDFWLAIMAGFLMLGAIGGYSHARLLARIAQAPRHPELVCPSCGSAPPLGEFWRCTRCFKLFDLFAPDQSCPKADRHATDRSCQDCGRQFPQSQWMVAPRPDPGQEAQGVTPE